MVTQSTKTATATHCCQRLTHAQSITKEDITQEGDGQFLVKSQSDNKISYHVHFGDCSNMPSCTCPDWQRHHWPCKHFVAIYKHFPEWGWEAMSPYYSSSPYFQIDPNVVPPLSSKGCSSTDCTIMQDSTQKEKEKGSKEYSSKCTSSTKRPVAHEDSEKKAEVAGKSSKQSVSVQNEGRCCRELLKEIRDLTYLCADGGALESLKQDLQKALGNFRPLVPSENGIFMEVTQPKKNIMAKPKKAPLETGPQCQKKKYAHLPLRLRLKRKNSHPIQLPCQPKKPATLPQSQKKSFNICHNLANNPKEVFIKREKEEKDDTLKMTSTSEQDTQPFFNENITPLPQNTTIPITSGTCDEPKMQKTTSTTISSTTKNVTSKFLSQ